MNKNTDSISPFSESQPIKRKVLSTNKIISNYNLFLKIDVKRFFKNINYITLYECVDSGFAFYYPYNTDGDGKFYEGLSRFEWYYSPWKWEHEEALKFVKPGSKILEVGCAKGAFLERVKEIVGDSPVGLELNEDAVQNGKKKDIDIRNQMLSEHACDNKMIYDVVCSFQVVEHISFVKKFIEDKLQTLKTGGLLVFSVPNNDSFIKDDPFPILNMPPHHMGLWNKKAISYLENVFPIKLISLLEEPFDERQYNYYIKIKLTRFFKSQFLATAIMKLNLHQLFFNKNKVIKSQANMPGHSIMAVFEKLK